MPGEGTVRSLVVISVCLAVAALGVATFRATTPTVHNPHAGSYSGARIMPPGPGANGLPLVPVRINEAGFLEGVPSHLDWYSYCEEGAPGLDASVPAPNVFVYDANPYHLELGDAAADALWFEPSLGRAARADDFNHTWQAAEVVWRSSQSGDDRAKLRVVVIKVDPSIYPEKIRDEFMPDGFAAFNAADTHFCCEVGLGVYHSPKARDQDGFPYLYEGCHDDRYDIRDIRSYTMPPGMEGGR